MCYDSAVYILYVECVATHAEVAGDKSYGIISDCTCSCYRKFTYSCSSDGTLPSSFPHPLFTPTSSYIPRLYHFSLPLLNASSSFLRILYFFSCLHFSFHTFVSPSTSQRTQESPQTLFLQPPILILMNMCFRLRNGSAKTMVVSLVVVQVFSVLSAWISHSKVLPSRLSVLLYLFMNSVKYIYVNIFFHPMLYSNFP